MCLIWEAAGDVAQVFEFLPLMWETRPKWSCWLLVLAGTPAPAVMGIYGVNKDVDMTLSLSECFVSILIIGPCNK